MTNTVTNTITKETIKNILPNFVKLYPNVVKNMKNTNHGYENNSNKFHLEGDIFTHSMMVYKEALTRYPDDYKLHIATLLHDIGKCEARTIVTNDKGTRARFFGHEGISVYSVINMLNSEWVEPFNLTYDDKILILNTIALHGDFFDSFSKDVSPMIKKFNSYEQFEYVRKHLICDHNGRLSLDDHSSEDIDNFEYSTYQLHASGMVHTNKEPLPQLVVLVGPPCSGKSTFIEANYANYVKISRDDTLMEYYVNKYTSGISSCDYNIAFKQLSEEEHKEIDNIVANTFRNAVKVNMNIVIDMTNMSPKARRKWSVSKSYWKTAVVFYTDMDDLKLRNNTRAEQTGKYIPQHVIVNMCKNFKLPTYAEFDDVKYIINT